MKLKEKLAVLRGKQGLTQGELASKMNLSRQTVYKWEQGTAVPSTENLILLGELYGISLDELVGGEAPAQARPATAVAVAEEPDAPPEPRKRWAKIMGGAVLAACLLLVITASVITIYSAVFKEPEKPKDGLTIISQDDVEWEDIDLSKVENLPDTMTEQKE